MSTLLIDSANVFCRAHYSTGQHLANGALFGYVKIVKALEDSFDSVIHCFEGGGAAARRELDANYKSDREGTSVFDSEAVLNITSWAQVSGHTIARADGCEADDVIAALSSDDVYRLRPVTIFSADHDFKQCLREDVVQMLPDKSLRTADMVREEIGRDPSEYYKVLAIAGDQTDSVKNVPRVGTITALKILDECEWDLERVVEHEKVKAHADLVMSNVPLVRFIVPEIHELELCSYGPRNEEALDEFYREQGFESLVGGKRAWQN